MQNPRISCLTFRAWPDSVPGRGLPDAPDLAPAPYFVPGQISPLARSPLCQTSRLSTFRAWPDLRHISGHISYPIFRAWPYFVSGHISCLEQDEGPHHGRDVDRLPVPVQYQRGMFQHVTGHRRLRQVCSEGVRRGLNPSPRAPRTRVLPLHHGHHRMETVVESTGSRRSGRGGSRTRKAHRSPALQAGPVTGRVALP